MKESIFITVRVLFLSVRNKKEEPFWPCLESKLHRLFNV